MASREIRTNVITDFRVSKPCILKTGRGIKCPDTKIFLRLAPFHGTHRSGLAGCLQRQRAYQIPN